jgi:hypothetical protein
MKQIVTNNIVNFGEILNERLDALARASAHSFGNRHLGGQAPAGDAALRQVVRDLLPGRFGVGAGFVASVEQGKLVLSAPQDIVVYDRMHNAPLLTTPDWSLFPIEMVYATVDVRETLKNGAAKDRESVAALAENVKTLRDMSRAKSYIHPSHAHDEHGNPVPSLLTWSDDTPPRHFLFLHRFRSNQVERFKEAVIQARKDNRDFFYNGIFAANRNWFAACRAYRDPAQVHIDAGEAWVTFLSHLALSIESIPAHHRYNRLKYLPHLGALYQLSEIDGPHVNSML